MSRQMKILLAIFILICGGIIAWNIIGKIMMKQFFANFQPPPATVSSAKAVSKTWYPYIKAVGTLEAVNGVNISSEVAGMIEEIYFTSGQMVNKRDLLLKLNDDIDQAELKNHVAKLKLAQSMHERDVDLAKKNAVSKSALDKSEAELLQAEAMVERTAALIEKKNITAPFSGKLGIKQVNIGQNIQAGTPIVNIQSLNPLHVLFSMPETYFTKIYVGQPVKLKVEAHSGEVFNGEVIAVNSKIDEHTRNISVLGLVSNDDQHLYPGMFADIEISLPEKESVITVPQTAISYNLYGDSVFVISDEGYDEKDAPILKVHRQYVTVGQAVDSEIEIIEGLKGGEMIVTSGQLKLDEGTRVIINNAVQIH